MNRLENTKIGYVKYLAAERKKMIGQNSDTDETKKETDVKREITEEILQKKLDTIAMQMEAQKKTKNTSLLLGAIGVGVKALSAFRK